MSVAAPTRSRTLPVAPVVSVRELLPWAAFVTLLGLVVLYFVGVDQGAMSLTPGSLVHEFMHDGRHLLGFPCH